MKKAFCVFCLMISLLFAGCSQVYTGTEGLIQKAREEIPIADAQTVPLVIAGSSQAEGNLLFWFISGGTYQSHSYTPIEFFPKGNDRYTFVKTYTPLERGMDIAVLQWKEGYSFLINNPACTSLHLQMPDGTTRDIPVEEIPFVYYTALPSTYTFLDAEGNPLS